MYHLIKQPSSHQIPCRYIFRQFFGVIGCPKNMIKHQFCHVTRLGLPICCRNAALWQRGLARLIFGHTAANCTGQLNGRFHKFRLMRGDQVCKSLFVIGHMGSG